MTDYIFKPFEIKDGRCVLAPDAIWAEPLEWEQDSWARMADSWANSTIDKPPMSVLLDCDPFVAFDGPIVNRRSERLWYDTQLQVPRMFAGVETADNCLSAQSDTRAVAFADVVARLFALIDATPNLRWLWLTDLPCGPATESEGANTSDEDYLEGTPVACRDKELSHELTCMIGRLAAIQCDYGLNTQACIDALVALRAELYELEKEPSER